MLDLDIGSSGGGDFRPILKFNAKAGRFAYRNSEGEKEINPISLIFDLGNIATGWMLFREGQMPSRVYDPNNGTRAEKPSSDHKRGFTVLVAVPKDQVGEENICEMSSTSMHLGNAIKEVWASYREGCDANQGKVPLITIKGVNASKDKFGTNYKPDLALDKWVDRPDGLADAPAVFQIPSDDVAPIAAHQAPPSGNGASTEF
ncbi:MAG: hypothetical protein VCE75_10430 [Alphaproteobacteria bacterium]